MASDADNEQRTSLEELAKRHRGGWVSTLQDDGTWITEDFGEPLVDLLPDSILRVFVNLACDQLERERRALSHEQ